MSKAKFIIIRHGQSIGNAKKLYLGHTDLGLSETGHEQAKVAAEYHKNTKIDAIYSSDLKRAHETALPHAKIHSLPINDNVGLREIFLGDWEGMPIEELKTVHRDEFFGGWHDNFGTYTVPGGESVLGAGKRFLAAMAQIGRENMGKTVLITAHAAVIRSFWCLISEVSPEKFASFIDFPTNASTSTAEFDGERFIPIEYSFDGYFKKEI